MSDVTCTHPCSNCYAAGGSQSILDSWSRADLKALCASQGRNYYKDCATVTCAYNASTKRCDCKLACCDPIDDGAACDCEKVAFSTDFDACPFSERDNTAKQVSEPPCDDGEGPVVNRYYDGSDEPGFAYPAWKSVRRYDSVVGQPTDQATGGCCEKYECEMDLPDLSFPLRGTASTYQAYLSAWAINWQGNFAGTVDSYGRYNAMQQPDDISLALGWAWATMIEAIEIINSVVCRFFGTDEALKVVQAIEWMNVNLVVTTVSGLPSFWALPSSRAVRLFVRTGVSSEETKPLFEHLADVIADEKGAPSEKTRCAVILLVGSLVHEIVHVVRGESSFHELSNCDFGGENCEPMYALECRLMEALATAFGVALCAAPCAADGTEEGAIVGACPPCKSFDGTVWYHGGPRYDLPIQRAVGVTW